MAFTPGRAGGSGPSQNCQVVWSCFGMGNEGLQATTSPQIGEGTFESLQKSNCHSRKSNRKTFKNHSDIDVTGIEGMSSGGFLSPVGRKVIERLSSTNLKWSVTQPARSESMKKEGTV